jgi:hypothetical protein
MGSGLACNAVATDLAGAAHCGSLQKQPGVTHPTKIVMAAKQPDFRREWSQLGIAQTKSSWARR